jgi:hypothetical protein
MAVAAEVQGLTPITSTTGPKMRHLACLLLSVLLFSSASVAGESRPLTQDESDMLVYLKSVGADPMKWMCEPLTKDMPDFEAKLSTWKAQNQEAIDRGRQAQTARLKDGETIEQYEIGVQANLKAMLAKTPPEKIAWQCLGFIASVTPKKPE